MARVRSFRAAWTGILLIGACALALPTCSIDPEGDCVGPCADGGAEATVDSTVDSANDAREDRTRDSGKDRKDSARDTRPPADVVGDGRKPCTGPSDCPVQEACDTATGACVASCSPKQPCHGGCCNAGACAAGTSATACGDTGGSCSACAGMTGACVAGACSASCDAGGCGKNFCCTSMGMCAMGDKPTSCGSVSPCTDCTTSEQGRVCLPSNVCGCNNEMDCPANMACSSGVCQMGCSGGLKCNGGCCDGTNCQPGSAPAACGTNGMTCNSCTAGAGGAVCESDGTCGCSTQTDCPAVQACTGNKCGPGCGGMGASPCNAGCCDGANCQPGTRSTNCGPSGGSCAACTAAEPACQVDGGCGPCATAADCPPMMACNTSSGTCSATCEVFGSSGIFEYFLCNGGCCDPGTSMCVTGTGDKNCGSDGNYCAFCGCSTPKCVAVPAGGACGCTSDGDCPGYLCGSSCNLGSGTAGVCM